MISTRLVVDEGLGEDSATAFAIKCLQDMWLELLFVCLCMVASLATKKLRVRERFAAGFVGRRQSVSAASAAILDAADAAIRACTQQEDMLGVIGAWQQAQQGGGGLSPGTLRLVVRALAAAAPETLVRELAPYLRKSSKTSAASVVIEELFHAARADLADQVHTALHADRRVKPKVQVYEALLGGHASAGHEARVGELSRELVDRQQRLNPRARVLIVKGFLTAGLLDGALKQTQAMLQLGLALPMSATKMLFTSACEADRAAEVLKFAMARGIQLSPEVLGLVLDDCGRRADWQMACQVEAVARDTCEAGSLPHSIYCLLLKVAVKAGNVRALDLFAEMRREGVTFSDEYCTSIIARCTKPKLVRLAEDIMETLRNRGTLSLACFGAMLKVYTNQGFQVKACDLYTEIRVLDITPDSAMRSCLMKQAVAVGRPEMVQSLFDEMTQLDGAIEGQNYIMLIQSMKVTKDVDRAFAALQALRKTDKKVWNAAYNCVLDVCVCAGELGRARELLAEMREEGILDRWSYNTILKGVCATKDKQAWQDILDSMEEDGFKCNEISYNCMINAAVQQNDLAKAWNLLQEMEAAGLQITSYTVSIILKAFRGQDEGQCGLHRALALLDRPGLDLSDPVLLHGAMEVCVRHRVTPRLKTLVSIWDRLHVPPTQQTLSYLIRAHSMLKAVDRCRQLWAQMIDSGQLPDRVVLGCMVDALVCDSRVREALELFREWRVEVGEDYGLYTTLLKGLATQGKVVEAMEVWKELRRGGGRSAMNVVLYNVLINAQAKIGNMDLVKELLQAMLEDGVGPDCVTYSTMIKGYCMKGKEGLEKACEYFHAVEKQGVVFDCVVYNVLINGCISHNCMDLADEILEDFERKNIKPSPFTVGTLVKMYGKREELDKAFAVLNHFRENHGLEPNRQVKSCMMSACIRNGKMRSALQIWESLQADGVADARPYGVIISGCARYGLVGQAVKYIEEAYGLRTGRRVLPPRQYLPAECLEHTLRATRRQGLQSELGVPLFEALTSAGEPVQDRWLAIVMDKVADKKD